MESPGPLDLLANLCHTERDFRLLLDALGSQAKCVAGVGCDTCHGVYHVVDAYASQVEGHVVVLQALCPRGEEVREAARYRRSGLPPNWVARSTNPPEFTMGFASSPLVVIQRPLPVEDLYQAVHYVVTQFKRDARYVHVPSLWKARNLDREVMWQDLSGAALVVLDGWDIGVPVDWFLDTLVEIVDNRISNDYPTALRLRQGLAGRTELEAEALQRWSRAWVVT